MNGFKTTLGLIHRSFLELSVNDQEHALNSLTSLVQELNAAHYRSRVQEEATKSVAGEAERILMERFSNDWTSFAFPDSMQIMGNYDLSLRQDSGECSSSSPLMKPKDDHNSNDSVRDPDTDSLASTISLITTSGSPKYQCYSCSYAATNRKALYRHGIQTDHQTRFVDTAKEGAFNCQLCTFTSNRKFNYDRHMQRAHFSIRNHICEVCSAGFKDKDTLKGHARNVHKIFFN